MISTVDDLSIKQAHIKANTCMDFEANTCMDFDGCVGMDFVMISVKRGGYSVIYNTLPTN